MRSCSPAFGMPAAVLFAHELRAPRVASCWPGRFRAKTVKNSLKNYAWRGRFFDTVYIYMYMYVYVCICIYIYIDLIIYIMQMNNIYVYIYTQCQNSPIFKHPNFFFGRKAIARCSSSAARPMRTAAARIAPLDPQLTSSKREAAEQTV